MAQPLLLRRLDRRRLGDVELQDVGRDEDDQLAVRAGLRRLRPEEEPEHRNVAEERHLLDALILVPLADAADREGLALLDDDLRRRRTLVDAWHVASGRRDEVPQ